jgi:hypothetical protein
VVVAGAEVVVPGAVVVVDPGTEVVVVPGAVVVVDPGTEVVVVPGAAVVVVVVESAVVAVPDGVYSRDSNPPLVKHALKTRSLSAR